MDSNSSGPKVVPGVPIVPVVVATLSKPEEEKKKEKPVEDESKGPALVPGPFLGTVNDLDNVVRRICTLQQRSHRVQKRSTSRYRAVCSHVQRRGKRSTSDCQFNVTALVQDGKVLISKRKSAFNLKHTCSTSGRKRQYSHSRILSDSPAIANYESTAVRGSRKELQQVAKAQGLDLKDSLAYNLLRVKKQDTAEQLLLGFGYVRSLLSILEKSDTALHDLSTKQRNAGIKGKYVLETQDVEYTSTLRSSKKQKCAWPATTTHLASSRPKSASSGKGPPIATSNDDNGSQTRKAFKRCFLAPSATQGFWACKHTLPLLGVSSLLCGSPPLRATLLVAVGRNAEDQPQLLAFAVVDEHSHANWLWFLQHLFSSFPPKANMVLLADGDNKAILESAIVSACLEEHKVALSFPANDLYNVMVADARKSNVPLTPQMRALFLEASKATDVDVWNKALGKLKLMSPFATAWAEAHKKELSTVSFLERGIPRYGEHSQELVQEVLHELGAVRIERIDKMIEGILHFMQREWLARRKAAAEATAKGQPLLGSARGYLEAIQKPSDAPVLVAETANEMKSIKAHVDGYVVMADASKHTISCGCGYTAEKRIPCAHGIRVVSFASDSPDYPDDWDVQDPAWVSQAYHTSTFTEQYKHAMVVYKTANCLEHDMLLPSPHLEPTKRSHKRKAAVAVAASSSSSSSTVPPKPKRQRYCRYCGKAGHFSKTCQQPDPLRMFSSFELHIKRLVSDDLAPNL